MHMDTRATGSRDNVRRHGKRGRRNEVKAYGVEAQECDQAVNRASVLQVSEKRDGLAIDSTEFGTDSVGVK